MSLPIKVDASNLGEGKLFGIFVSNSWTKDHLGFVPLQWRTSPVSVFIDGISPHVPKNLLWNAKQSYNCTQLCLSLGLIWSQKKDPIFSAVSLFILVTFLERITLEISSLGTQTPNLCIAKYLHHLIEVRCSGICTHVKKRERW
jgi:hypothetical protein